MRRPDIAPGELTPVSPRLIPARYIGNLPWWGFFIVGSGVLIFFGVRQNWWWMHLIAAILLLLIIQSVIFVARRVRALGYATREDDLVTASGILFRSVEIIPYGRIQTVTVSEGPIERRFGLATVALTTASSDSSASLSGLPKAEAERVRDLLTSRGVSAMASL
ncbi:PH domain-containing protein [Devriesea agamarum]|uniref:PH domain-containing protein n=1 Tax=Devriesea agamarum TaxID=472569 RepID=UPI00071DB3EA|nr:PH domain-containing protein [Devriesea agamarum]